MTQSFMQAQWYGQNLYASDSTVLVSAKRTVLNAGYLMAGHRTVRQNGSPNADFIINKVDAYGNYTSANDFMGSYQIIDNCSLFNFPYNCYGVDAVECYSVFGSQNFLVAATYSNGLAILTLDNAGNPLTKLHFPFPAISTADPARSPRIRESATPGYFYICGNFNFQSYVIKIDITNPLLISPVWSNWYTAGIKLDAADLIESPYNVNDLIVVGRTDANFSPSTGADAFFMNLNSSTGAVNGYSVYNKFCDGDEWFTCIEQTQSTIGGSNGYVLGGRSVYPFKATCNATVSGTSDGFAQWMCKLDPNGAVVWSSLIEPYASASYTSAASFSAYPPLSSDISDVAERYNSYTGKYEYFGVGGINLIPVVGGTWSLGSNLVVYKLDDYGTNSISPNEFHYLAGIGHLSPSPLSDAQLSLIETAGGADDGIQVFGNEDGTYKNHYMVKAYFNGESGCHDANVNMTGIRTGPSYLASPSVSANIFSPVCGSGGFNIFFNLISIAPTIHCSASSLLSGNNLKPNKVKEIMLVAEENSDLIYPNPSSGKVTIKSDKIEQIESIELCNSLGELIYSNNNININNQSKELIIDLLKLNLYPGLYLLKINDSRVTKIVFTGD